MNMTFIYFSLIKNYIFKITIHLYKNPGNFSKSKHIDTRYHFLREQVVAGSIILLKVDTKKNIADIFTKPLSNIMFTTLAAPFMYFAVNIVFKGVSYTQEAYMSP